MDIPKRADELLKKKNVIGYGIGKKKSKNIIEKFFNLFRGDCLVVYVQEKQPLSQLSAEDKIPEVFDGVLTDVEQGEFYTMGVYKEKHRPIKVGSSMCNFYNTACTAGIKLYKGGKIYSLVNEHCSRKIMADATVIGDPVSQPSRMDGGTIDDIVGKVAEFCPRTSENDNMMDSALIEMSEPMLDETITCDYLQEIDSVGIGDRVWKDGRTSGHTEGEVRTLSTTVMVGGGDGKQYKMVDQIVTTKIADPGDSSSAVFKGKKVIGQLHAGSDQFTVVTPIDRILSYFQASLTQDPDKYIALGPWVEIDKTTAIMKSKANLRSEPKIGNNVLTVLPIGAKLEIVEGVKETNSHTWLKIK